LEASLEDRVVVVVVVGVVAGAVELSLLSLLLLSSSGSFAVEGGSSQARACMDWHVCVCVLVCH
jgi:hypothetical protein